MSAHPTVPADPQKASEILLECYSERAGAEALFRAFLRERDLDRDGAEFWLEVYGLITTRPLSE